MYDPYYHPSCNRELRRKTFAGPVEGEGDEADEAGGPAAPRALGLQLYRLELKSAQ